MLQRSLVAYPCRHVRLAAPLDWVDAPLARSIPLDVAAEIGSGGWLKLQPQGVETPRSEALSASTMCESVPRGVEVLRQEGKQGLTNEVDGPLDWPHPKDQEPELL